MSIPQLSSFQPGVGVYGADWANTVLQAGCLISHLRAFTGYPNMTVMTIGGAAPNDGLGQCYYWNPSSTATDNGSTIIVPSGSTQGAWIAIGSLLNGGTSSSLVIATTAAGTNALTLTPISMAPPSAYSTGQTFSFVAPATTTGAVTVAVGGLSAAPVFSRSGKTQLGTLASSPQDLVQGATYLITYSSALNNGAGGFQVTGGGGQNIIDAPFIAYQPTNNPIQTLSSLVVQAVSAPSTTRQFLGSFGLVSNSGGTGGDAGNVAVYAAVDGIAGSTHIWSINSLTTMDATFNTASSAIGYELDFNNFCQARGATDGIAGLSSPNAEGLLVTGAGTFGSQAAVSVNGNTQSVWYRGFNAASGIVSASFADYSTATIGIEMQATHAGWGIDMLFSAFGTGGQGGAIRIPNNTVIVARNNANTADVTIATVATNGNLILGANNAAGNQAAAVVFGVGAYPVTDNAYQMGTSTNRFTSIWAANGAIQTSDPSLKMDIKPLPSVMDVVARINPITFRWKTGGLDEVEVQEEREVQDTVTVEYDHHEIKVEGGRAMKLPVRKVETRDAWDEVPLLDHNGQQIMTTIPAREALYDQTGRLIREATPEHTVPEWHRVPRMVKKTVTIKKLVEREGRRTHWGFDATEVKAAFDAAGVDFGGYVRGADGTHHLRPDQLIPVLWRAIQELKAEIDALKAGPQHVSP